MSGKRVRAQRQATQSVPAIRALKDTRFGKILISPEQGQFLKNLETYKADYDRTETEGKPGAYNLPFGRLNWVVEQVCSYPTGCKVLDIGCRTGEVLWPLSQRERFDLYGIEMMEQYVQHCHEMGLQNVQQGFAEKLPWKNAFFDIVICTEVLEHVIDPDVVLREAERVLKPGGVVLISTPYGPWELGGAWAAYHHVREFNPEALRARGTHFVVQKQPFTPEWAKGQDVGNYLVTYRKARAAAATPRKVPTRLVPDEPRIAFYLPDIGAWKPIDPADPFAGALGGRETATVRLAQELNRLGWRVSVFTVLKDQKAFDQGGIAWWPASQKAMTMQMLGQKDVVVSVEHPEIFRTVRAPLNILHEQCAHLPVRELDAKIDNYFLISLFQQWSLRKYDPQIDADKCVVFGNGIDLGRFDNEDIARVPGRLVYSSSPDRGLHHLLRMWPALKARHPHLSLRVFYDIKQIEFWHWTMEMRADWCRIIDQGRNLPGVDYVGPVDQVTLAREQKMAELFVYPCDPSKETETFAITCLECAAAGTPMLLSKADCLPEVYGKVAFFLDVPIVDQQWLDGVTNLLEHPDTAQTFVPAARALAERQTWASIASRWNTFLRKRLGITDREAATVLAEDTSEVTRRLGVGEALTPTLVGATIGQARVG